MLTYFSSNGVLRAGVWECQVWISHRHIRGRPNLLSYSHSHCIIVSKRECWFDVRTEPKKIKENKIRVWAVSDKAVVCERWHGRCVWTMIVKAIVYEWWYGRWVWTMIVKASVCVRWHGRCVWAISVKATVCQQLHARYVWTASDMAIVCEQWQGRSVRTVSDTATPCEQRQGHRSGERPNGCRAKIAGFLAGDAAVRSSRTASSRRSRVVLAVVRSAAVRQLIL
jgi:hypothetical protein